MTDISKDPRVDSTPQPTQNPGGEASIRPEDRDNESGHNVSGDEAEEAGRRATADEPVTPREVLDQSAYKDDSADVGQQAGTAERESDQEDQHDK